VILSGWSANLIKGENVEDLFTELTDVSVTIMRPGSFYTNFYFSMDLIKGKGFIGKYLTLRYSGLLALLRGRTGLLMGNYGGDDKIVFVSPKDIAEAVAEELINPPTEKVKIHYVGSEEMTCNEAAKIIGTAIGKPYLKWVLISDKQMLQGLKMAKMPQELAETMVEMQSVMHSGAPLKNFHQNNPKMGKVKLTDFAKEFAVVYNQK
jgi:NAD(P)H dehydrogenase (quinone)